MSDGSIAAIWIKRFKRGPMDAVESAELIAGKGLAGNACRSRTRQVTLIEEEVWSRVREEVDASIEPSQRRANVMVRGIRLYKTRGRILRLGDCRIRIFGEVTPCERMDEVFDGLRTYLKPEWRGGGFGEVVEGGVIRVGDRVAWDDVKG